MLEIVIGTIRFQQPLFNISLALFINLPRYCQAVDDIMSAVQNILEFIVVDLIGIVFSAGLCYKMTGFNIFKTLGYLQKEYGLMLTVSQVLTLKNHGWFLLITYK